MSTCGGASSRPPDPWSRVDSAPGFQSDAGRSSSAVDSAVCLAGNTLGHRAHICAFFNGADEAYRLLLPFIKEGLERGEKAVHTVAPNQYGEHIRRLESAGIDVPAGRKHDQLELLNWGDTPLRGGKFHPDKTLALFEEIVHEAKHKGFRLIRFVTQMEWVLETDMDLNDLLEYEAKANHVWLGQEGPVNLVVCTYDLRRFRGDVVVDIMRTHPMVIIGGILQDNPFFVAPEALLKEFRERPAKVKLRHASRA